MILIPTLARKWLSKNDKFYNLLINLNYGSFFLIDFFDIESELAALEDIPITSSGLTGSAGDTGVNSS